MTTMKSSDGRTVEITSKGQTRGQALLICRDAEGKETAHVFPIAQARTHFASLYEQGWR